MAVQGAWVLGTQREAEACVLSTGHSLGPSAVTPSPPGRGLREGLSPVQSLDICLVLQGTILVQAGAGVEAVMASLAWGHHAPSLRPVSVCGKQTHSC